MKKKTCFLWYERVRLLSVCGDLCISLHPGVALIRHLTMPRPDWRTRSSLIRALTPPLPQCTPPTRRYRRESETLRRAFTTSAPSPTRVCRGYRTSCANFWPFFSPRWASADWLPRTWSWGRSYSRHLRYDREGLWLSFLLIGNTGWNTQALLI